MPILAATLDDPLRSRLGLAEAESCLARKDRRAALAALRTAFRFDPGNDEIPMLAAMLHLQDGDQTRAARLAIEAQRMRPFHPQALNL
ncbi:MAG TPA: hypothetical protein VFT43_07470, partial [Candidatus Polarisedimenticolia bacterium]|nr:hypothetical protein [Candidatus Polarisedimenticolia bacterium]